MRYLSLLLLAFLFSIDAHAQLDTCDVPIHAVSDTPCSARILHLSVDSLPNTTYSWQGPGGWTAIGDTVMRDSILSIQTGKYIVTGIHGDCAYTDTVDVFIRSSPTTPHILLNNSPICAGDTLIVFAPTSGFSAPTYYLNPNNDVLLFTYIDTLILPNMQPNMAGIYGVYTSGIQGCYSDTVHFNVQVDSCTLNATNVSETQPFIPTLLQSQDAVFKPTFTTNPRDFHMLILDATGRKVFETKNLSGWNRESYRGIFYYYIQITIGSKIAIYKGKLITL